MAQSRTYYASGRSNDSKVGQVFIATMVCIIAMLGAMWGHGDIGVLQQSMVAGSARKAAALPTEWPLASAYGDNVTSLLFYSPERDAFEARVYERHTGMAGMYLKFGWFPACSYAVQGSDSMAEEMQAVWYAPQTLRGERAYFSMNAAGAAEARTADGASYAILVPDAPFALVGPEGLVFVDEAGNEVPCRTVPDSAE